MTGKERKVTGVTLYFRLFSRDTEFTVDLNELMLFRLLNHFLPASQHE